MASLSNRIRTALTTRPRHASTAQLVIPVHRSQQRLFSSSRPCSSSTPLSYPFASAVQVLPPSPPPTHPKTSLLRTLNLHLTSQHPLATEYTALFSRRHPTRVQSGSVLTVISYTALPTTANPQPSTTTFSGVLMAMRRRHAGRDTSIRLRNLVGRTGVEQSFKVFSPMIKEIKIVQRATKSVAATGSGKKSGDRRKPVLRASRRAKMYFVREQPDRLVGVSGIVKQAREREAALEKRKR
ncbi:BZ3500_MvSof-1268-A1-R1_Chr2-1g04341 [Microbotryum saponariae]|uniref:BZ3500_MvSof-1268-A1-R1_Chr2-1g04341 protein n=1 Tax=Microbotryum saponariae TaxID=289078 RepID=A0A2X0KIL0_9BASI|nr:BZ3500_MvSof-1268-A1-R1_Chr2-1g04341 [Microbotryum saponariae]SCZ91488.1 BZ3501_MvSof-1269-A2-R1_Chr2-1g03997 [Microbotryum saponariae]